MKKPLRKIPTPQNLANVALHYLGRYAASEASLRRVLTNRIRRAAMQHPDFAADADRQKSLRSAIETIIETHKRTGVLNDAAFAAIKINSLRRQGRSRRIIEQKLGVKGIAGTVIQAALVAHDDGAEPQDVEFKAAAAFARRRKLGSFRKVPVDDDRRRKEFATMARAGFAVDIIRKVLNTQDLEIDMDFDA